MDGVSVNLSHLSMFLSVCHQCLLFCFDLSKEKLKTLASVCEAAECWWLIWIDGVNGTVSSVTYIAKCDIFSGLRLSLS